MQRKTAMIVVLTTAIGLAIGGCGDEDPKERVGTTTQSISGPDGYCGYFLYY